MMAASNAKLVEKLRRIANGLDNLELKIWVLATIACVTGDKLDILQAVDTAHEQAPRKSFTAKALAIITKALARALRFQEAREIADGMEGMDTYWHAEACISILRHSGIAEDLDKVQKVIGNIRNHDVLSDVRGDLKLALEKHHHVKERSFNHDLVELSSVLDQLKAFEHGDKVPHYTNSAFLILMAETIIGRIFAETMK